VTVGKESKQNVHGRQVCCRLLDTEKVDIWYVCNDYSLPRGVLRVTSFSLIKMITIFQDKYVAPSNKVNPLEEKSTLAVT